MSATRSVNGVCIQRCVFELIHALIFSNICIINQETPDSGSERATSYMLMNETNQVSRKHTPLVSPGSNQTQKCPPRVVKWTVCIAPISVIEKTKTAKSMGTVRTSASVKTFVWCVGFAFCSCSDLWISPLYPESPLPKVIIPVCRVSSWHPSTGFPLSEARGKDGPFIPCYASLPLEVSKGWG